MIITITMNPAIDRGVSVEKMTPEKKMRCVQESLEVGGGGINVSKAIKELGGLSYAIFPSGGENGRYFEEILADKDIPHTAIKVASNTRENLTVVETASNLEYRFVMPGHELSSTEFDRCFSTIVMLSPLADIMVVSGSTPKGVPDDFYLRLAEVARKSNALLVIDASGKSLKLALEAGTYLLKPNLSELASLVNKESVDEEEVKAIGQDIIGKGQCKMLVVSLGKRGAILLADGVYEEIEAPPVQRVSTVGAGDSMVAGMVWMLQQKKSFSEVARFGVACGTAATLNSGTQLFHKRDVYKLYKLVKTKELKL